MNEQPTAGHYQRAYERLVETDARAEYRGDGRDLVLRAFILGSNFEPDQVSASALALWRVFMGAELIELQERYERLAATTAKRQCGYCDGTGQVEFCDDVCQCGPTRCATCNGTGVLQ